MTHSKDDDLAFFQEMQDVTPIKQSDTIAVTRRERTLAQQLKREALEKEQRLDGNFLAIEAVAPVNPIDPIAYKKDGVQDGVFKNLRLGKYQVDSQLNIQQQSVEKAREQVFDTIVESQRRGIRTLVIRHGLGKNSKPFPGLLKSYVNVWLKQMDQVLAFHTALPQHGGQAAVYVLLKKGAEEKLENRERHKRR